jgi:type II secretory pathway component PulK
VRLIVNENLYSGPLSARPFCTGTRVDDDTHATVPVFPPVRIGPGSFVIADKLAACHFEFLQPNADSRQKPSTWVPRWTRPVLPDAIRLVMAPLANRRRRNCRCCRSPFPCASIATLRWIMRIRPFGALWGRLSAWVPSGPGLSGRPSHFQHAASAAFSVPNGKRGWCRVPGSSERGSALLIVLWLSVALFAIAFTVAHMVRAEVDRVGTDADTLRAQYLAQAGIDRALLWIDWSAAGVRRLDGGPFYEPPSERLQFAFPSGEAWVELIPESSRLDINSAILPDLTSVMLAGGATPDQAVAIAAAVADWRQGDPRAITQFDQFYLSLHPSFRSPHASFREIEELLLVRGMTPELFYGGYRQAPDGRFYPYGGVRDCLSVYGSTTQFDVNTASPTLLAALGAPHLLP